MTRLLYFGGMLRRYPKLGKEINHRSRSTPAGRGSWSTQSSAPTDEQSSSMASVPTIPPLLISFPARHQPFSASLGKRFKFARKRSEGASTLAFQNGFSRRHSPRRSTATMRSSPGSASKLVIRRFAFPKIAAARNWEPSFITLVCPLLIGKQYAFLTCVFLFLIF